MLVPHHPPVCPKCFKMNHTKYNCPEGRELINLDPQYTVRSSIEMCYNCGEDNHKRENCPLPPNPPEFQSALRRKGVEAKRRAGVIPGFNRGGVEEQKRLQRQQWQTDGRSIPLRLIEKELEDVMIWLEEFKRKTISLRALRILQSEQDDDDAVVISRQTEVKAAEAELRSFLPRIKQIVNIAKGRLWNLNYLEVSFLDSYTRSIEEIRTELVNFIMPEARCLAFSWTAPVQ
ncbi:uncharacterized protein LOC110842900 [Folsomia candida]|uniref:CCHC-type domain-containing protein n=1 Tax=Folsomia candida TaxID=158441 RepID=A0A226EQP8_FOLCA|nr:uncharacterized protein LOC110842900 [Folsomia candida]XP_021944457.1 uncharacterized protein LOC110842900 [Folsomia candida]XP_021944459.1 uncharacterized protein LOC110842900 [Folsomia candida]OXA59590.1 hypothetical protein Fcan01_04339 [Folsomia candida]